MPTAYSFACQKARIVFFASVLLLTACGQKPTPQMGGMKVPVSVVTVEPTRTAILAELPGRVEAIKDAQIVARVTGIVTKVNFAQGSDVKQGQLLFTIDSAPYRATRDQAAAQLQQAQANVRSANLLAQRYSKLIKENAVSRQDYDNARATAGQAVAAVAAARAALESADINLSYTKVVSPIDGRTGKSLVTEGALVSASAGTQLATVQQIDRVYVDFTRSTTELAALRRALADGDLQQTGTNAAKAEVVLDDGSLFKQPGKVLFSGITVDPTTGQVNLRAVFPNPDQILLPGMYVRVQIEQGVDQKALLVPQQALQRTADGLTSLYVVKDGKVALTAVQVGPLVNGKSVIERGLKAGDVVVVEGFQKIRPGASVQAMPWKGGEPATAAKTPSPKPVTKG
ncbi:MAG: efflux RND transporter periplasmic adaptor subunit [Candidimonas sp.]|nr:MAG: efflux RND transporter periplasmic adaptor subunit [Candidimonas sp.]TAM24751.1 MAG: efflux RND transporter periplasmic adaptor subunit [Candidimonas sp.]TAM79993.1 MAG: efflux RND transporter periplasmic adaptor subunit [Candidimonas sp.]